MAVVFLYALIRAEAPVVGSELPTITRFLSNVFGRPVQIGSMQLRWRHFLPVFDLQNVNIQGDTPLRVSEMKLGWHFMLLRDFTVAYSSPSSPTTSLPVLSIDPTGYFHHVILEQAVININQYQFKFNRLDLHKKSGNFWVWKGNAASLDFGKLFIAPLFISTTTGALQLTISGDQWNVVAKNIAIYNKDISVLAKFTLSGGGNSSPVIDLKAHYEAGIDVVSDLKNYLPQTVLKPKVIEWLTHSIKSIGTGEGDLILKGTLSDFPFDKNPGEFLMDSNITGATLDYFNGWPEASQINAEMIFENTSMQIHVHSAELAYVPVENIEASIPVLGKNSVLTISGSVSSQVQNLLYFIDHSPLQKKLGKRFDGIQWTGPMTLGLNLKIPFDPPPTTVNGTINLKNTALKISDWGVSLQNMTGLLAFTEKGLSGQKVTANFENSPVIFTIDKTGIYHIQYKKYKADVTPNRNGGWHADVANINFRGAFDIPSDPMKQGIRGVLSYLTIDPNTMSSLTQQKIKPSMLPPLTMLINNLRYKALKFDQISFQSRHLSNGLSVEHFQVNGPGYSVVGQGKWLNNQQSSIDAKLNSNDLAKTVTSWGLDPSIQGAAGESDIHLYWPGAIYSPDFAHLSGTIDINVGKGQIITTGSEAKMDFGRLITLLSFQSLQRFLTLDFTNLTQQGLSFDSITGSMVLNNHGGATLKSVVLRSPIARVNLMGDINLMNKSYALHVMVTPHLTSSLPIIATIVGGPVGPVAGAAVWAASKVVNPLIDKVTADNYSVTGPWNNPVIKKE
ncbi:MAG TPA: DUF3971 domain-containing protein [Gammaproteobacteria bacterium]|nr:DUF3971 domain-containing protein [Gammaproteobacteria bacterium]